MKQIFFYILCLAIIKESYGQGKVNIDLGKLNEYLTEVYSNSTTFFDTTRLNYRNESYELSLSDIPNKRLNGLITLGILDTYARNTKSAIQKFNQAMLLDSNCYQCYLKLHWINFYILNNFQESNKIAKLGISKFESVVKKDSSKSENWSKLYNIYSLNESRQTVKSKQRMKYISRKRVELDSINPYYNWENSFHCDDKDKELYLLKAYHIYPSEDIFWNAIANYYCEKKNLAAVLRIMNEVKNEENDSSFWFQQMALFYYRLGRKTEAKEIYNEAKKRGFDIVYKY